MREITLRKNLDPPAALDGAQPDTLSAWLAAYFAVEVTTAPSSQQVQRRDIARFIAFVRRVERHEARTVWTARLSRAFLDALRSEVKETGGRRLSDRTVARIVAHLKTFAKWIHKLAPFPLGNPTEKLKTILPGTGLEIERAITPAERRKLLDAADYLPVVGGRSRNRRLKTAFPDERPRRKGYRPWRNRAIVYLLIETGMRRAAVVGLDAGDIDVARRTVSVTEKGGHRQRYQISREGLKALEEYRDNERGVDAAYWSASAAFFLPAANKPQSAGRLSRAVVNTVWNEVCGFAGVTGKTPHSARHAMGRHLIGKTGNVAAVQRQLGHKNAAYSLQYARITDDELQEAMDDR